MAATNLALSSAGESLRFRTGAAMPSRLGSEQLKDEVTAVIELVKNAYDADATNVRLDFRDSEAELALRIQDDGAGMTRSDLHDKWAWLATENKVREDRSPLLRRRRLGQKGVGRFATEKLGRVLILRTRVAGQSHVLQVRFNWEVLAGDRELGEYEFPIAARKPDPLEPEHGTRIEIRNLRIAWNRAHVEKLRAQLARLIDPEETATDFTIHVFSPWQDLSGRLESPLVGNETHRVSFALHEDGREEIEISRNGQIERRVSHGTRRSFGALRGRLRYFGQGLAKSERGRGGDPDADWNVGVRIFRDGCRVRPYGEPGHEGDWLQIYRTRYLKGSRFRLKPHYLEGAIHISKYENPDLRDTTSREGIEANDSFRSLVDFVQEKVALLSDLLHDEELREERSRMSQRYSKAMDPLSKGLSQVRSEEYRKAVGLADKQMRRSLEHTVHPQPTRNAHWECVDCRDSWKVPKELTPSHCREHSVGRDGKPSTKPGCGSSNIRRKENIHRDDPERPGGLQAMDDVLTGIPAYVSGIQLKPLVDWEMGENDEEAEVRPDRRELAINGRHAAFRAADRLDGNETAEGTTLEALRAVAALTIHVIDSASQAWGRWHYRQSGNQWDRFLTKAAELKAACLGHLHQLDES